VGIRYSDQIKKPNEEISYTPEMILELHKCSEDINYFLKYVKIIHPDRGIIQYNPYDFQKTILTNLQNNRFNVVLASRQSGKCLCSDTMIKVRNKKTGEIKEMSIYDFYEINKNKK
jgi:hypothetical protein